MANDRNVAVRLSVEGAEQVRAALLKLGEDGEKALKRINFDTSSSTGAKLFTSSLEEAQGAASGFATRLGPLGGILSSLGGGYLAAAAAGGAFLSVLTQSVRRADEVEQSQARLAAVLRATGDSAGLSAEQIEGIVDRLAASTLNSKDDIRAAAAELATFRNIGGDTFERTLKLAADLHTVFGEDLASSAVKLGRALDDPIQGMNALRRVGLDLSPAQKEVIANLQRTGDVAGAQKALLQDLTDKVGGAGGAAHTGLAGATHDLGVEWDNFLVNLGRTSGIADLASGAVNRLTGFIKSARDAFESGGFKNGFAVGGTVVVAPDQTANKPTPSLQPVSVTPGIKGRLDAERERDDEIDALLKSFVKPKPSGSERQRFIDQKIAEVAAKAELTPDALKFLHPDQFKALVKSAGDDFNATHGTRLADQAASRSDDFKQFFDGLVKANEQAQAALHGAEARANEDRLRGQAGFFAASLAAVKQWQDDQQKIIEAGSAAEFQTLDRKRREDKINQTQYNAAAAQLDQEKSAKLAALAAESGQRRLDIERRSEGALFAVIQKGSEDLNTSFKDVAANGLKSLESGFLGIVQGTEKVGKAFASLTASILSDVAKLILEKQVIAPLANLLNGLVDGSGKGVGGGSGFGGFLSSAAAAIFGSANGNVFESGNVIPFRDGGIVDRKSFFPIGSIAEESPEAILPLKRGANGKLGVVSHGQGGGDLHVYYSPTVHLNGVGVSREEVSAILAKHINDDLPGAVVRIHAQARSRGLIK